MFMAGNTKEFQILLEHSRNGSSGAANLRSLKTAFTQSVLSEIEHWAPKSFSVSDSDKPPIQVLDFFCGCGGMTLGFEALSKIIPIVEIVGGIDIDNEALQSYKKNFSTDVVNMDIRRLAEKDSELSKLRTMLPRFNNDRRTIIIGCAPCQGFTSHRKRNWHQDDNRNTLIVLNPILKE